MLVQSLPGKNNKTAQIIANMTRQHKIQQTVQVQQIVKQSKDIPNNTITVTCTTKQVET